MIKEKMPEAQIVFATAFRDYAVKAFEIGATDYLLKPFDYERVKKALDAAKIVYFETENRSCRIHMADGSSYLQNESLNNYENLLRECRFFRIHKSYLVNLDYVIEMQVGYNSGYCLRLRHYEKEKLPIGRGQIKEFRKIFEG